MRPRSQAEFLNFSESYLSVQGEGLHSGLLCYFIRTAVCDLRCTWCDTLDALSGGFWVSKSDILAEIPEEVELVQITGGEPLIQAEAIQELCVDLSNPPYNKKVLLETGGHRSLKGLPRSVHIVMDIKLPGSGEAKHDFMQNLKYLKYTDEIKFVIADRADYDAAVVLNQKHALNTKFQVLFSVVWGQLSLSDLAEWMIKDQLDVRLQTQLHKHIWGNRTGV